MGGGINVNGKTEAKDAKWREETYKASGCREGLVTIAKNKKMSQNRVKVRQGNMWSKNHQQGGGGGREETKTERWGERVTAPNLHQRLKSAHKNKKRGGNVQQLKGRGGGPPGIMK